MAEKPQKRTKLPTFKQKRLAVKIIENAQRDNPLNAKELLASVSYSPGLQKQPARIIESKGVQEALADHGFTSENARKVVARIMLKGKEENRLRASDMVFKVKGDYAPVKTVNINASMELAGLSDEELAEMAYKADIVQPQEVITSPLEADNSPVDARK